MCPVHLVPAAGYRPCPTRGGEEDRHGHAPSRPPVGVPWQQRRPGPRTRHGGGGSGTRDHYEPGCYPRPRLWRVMPGSCGYTSTTTPRTPVYWPQCWRGYGPFPYRPGLVLAPDLFCRPCPCPAEFPLEPSDWPWFEHQPVVSHALGRISYRPASLDPRSGGRTSRVKNPG